MKELNLLKMKDKFENWFEGSLKISVPQSFCYYSDYCHLFSLNTSKSCGTVDIGSLGKSDKLDLNIIAPPHNTNNFSLQLRIDYMYGLDIQLNDRSIIQFGNGSIYRNVTPAVDQRIFSENRGKEKKIIILWNVIDLIETNNAFIEDDLTKNFRR